MTTKSYIDEKVAEFMQFAPEYGKWRIDRNLASSFLRGSLQEAYSKGREDILGEVLKELPPERIIHEYMESQNTPENNAWNDYRNKTMEAIRALQSSE